MFWRSAISLLCKGPLPYRCASSKQRPYAVLPLDETSCRTSLRLLLEPCKSSVT